MTRQTRQFALCLKNTGNEASLILGKVYRIVPDARAAKDDLVRIIDESGEDYLFARGQFAFVEFPQPVRRKILALRRAAAADNRRSTITCVRCRSRRRSRLSGIALCRQSCVRRQALFRERPLAVS